MCYGLFKYQFCIYNFLLDFFGFNFNFNFNSDHVNLWEKTKIYIIRFSNFIKLGDYNRTIVFIWSVYKKYGVIMIIMMFSIIT